MSQGSQLSLFSPPDADKEQIDNIVSLLALDEIQGVGFGAVRSLFNHYNGKLAEVWNNNQFFHKIDLL